MSDIPSLGLHDVDWSGGGVGRVVYSDKRFVEFFRGQKKNGIRTEAEGRPIYDAVDMIRVRHPGERDCMEMEVQERHKWEFQRQWDAYQAGQKADMTGTPLSVLYPNDEATVKQMRSLHIFTAEMLAGLTEEGIRRLGMGGRSHVDRAKQYLEAARGMAGSHQLQAQLDREKEARAELESKLDLMQRQMAVLVQAQDNPRRSRKVAMEPTEMENADG